MFPFYRSMRKYTILFFLVLIILHASGQEMLGLMSSNYAGINCININPSRMVSSKLYMDYNLFNFNFFAQNDYHYIHREDINPFNWLSGGPYPEYGRFSSFTDIYRNGEPKSGEIVLRMNGPAALLVHGKHAYGFQTGFRMYTTFSNLEQDIANFLYETIDYKPQFNTRYTHDDNQRVGHMSWFEFDFSYAYNFYRFKWEYWSAGLTIKPLLGYSGLYANLYNIDYIVYNDSLADVFDSNFDYAYSAPISYNNNDYPEGPFIRGFGFGVDLGITYMKTTRGHGTGYFPRLCAQRYEDYNLKIGFSILDLGYIKFNKKAEKHVFFNAVTLWEKWNDTLPDSTFNTIDVKLDHYFSRNSKGSLNDKKFNMYLPPAFSFQVDIPFRNHFYLNGTLIYGFNIGDDYLKRPSVIAVIPRWEKSHFEFNFPVSMYEWDWKHPRIGASIRFGNFAIGSDKLGSILGFSDFSGLDFYFNLKLNLSHNFKMNYIKGNCGQMRFFNIETFDYRNF